MLSPLPIGGVFADVSQPDTPARNTPGKNRSNGGSPKRLRKPQAKAVFPFYAKELTDLPVWQ